ncbi:hypothetical protein HDV00_001070 [Rhizophlyctis rosea]|nr:hypothetical protein HDV00_001070 [Rhizophlyctis rosea]
MSESSPPRGPTYGIPPSSDALTDMGNQENEPAPFVPPMSSPIRQPIDVALSSPIRSFPYGASTSFPIPSPPRNNKRPRSSGNGSSSETELQSPSRRKCDVVRNAEEWAPKAHNKETPPASERHEHEPKQSTRLEWERGDNFGRAISLHKAAMGRELYGPSRGRRIIPTVRQQAQQFASTERDIFTCGDALGMHIPPFACAFSNVLNDGKYLAVADEDGTVGLIDAKHTNDWERRTNKRVEWTAHDNAIFDIAWTADDSQLVTVSGDQSARLWDVERRQIVKIFKGHGCTIKSVAAYKQNTALFATAARDGHIILWDTRAFTNQCDDGNRYLSPYLKFEKAHVNNELAPTPKKTRTSKKSQKHDWGNQPHGVTAVRFLDENYILSSGAADGLIKMWDVRNQRKPCDSTVSIQGRRVHGFSSFSLTSNGSRLYAASRDHNIYEFTTNNLSLPPRQLPSTVDYHCDSFYVRTSVSPDDRFVASGSSFGGVCVWEIDAHDKPPLVLRGHDREIAGVSWCPKDKALLGSVSDDHTVRLWRMRADCDELKDSPEYRGHRGFAVDATPRAPKEKKLPKHVPPETDVATTEAGSSSANATTSVKQPENQDENTAPSMGESAGPRGVAAPSAGGSITPASSRKPNVSKGCSSRKNQTPRSGQKTPLGSGSKLVPRWKSQRDGGGSSKQITDYYLPSSEVTDDER